MTWKNGLAAGEIPNSAKGDTFFLLCSQNYWSMSQLSLLFIEEKFSEDSPATTKCCGRNTNPAEIGTLL